MTSAPALHALQRMFRVVRTCTCVSAEAKSHWLDARARPGGRAKEGYALTTERWRARVGSCSASSTS